MKRLLPIVLTLMLVLVSFTACGGGDKTDEDTGGSGGSVVKTGLGVVSSVEKSTPPKGEKNGVAETDSFAAAVLVKEDGTLAKCKIDSAQTKIEFSKEGKVMTPLDTIFKSKQDLGEDYGLKKASGIGKEWNEQATAFADYCVGKTLDEIKGIAVNEKGAPTDSELSSSVTVNVGDFIGAVEKAVNNAKELGAGPNDTLGLGVETNIAHSANVTDKEDGVAQAYTNYVAVTFGSDNKITSSAIEGSQCDVTFDKNGAITSDLTAEQQTKQELGDQYGLKKASGIQKEWYEQANAFAAYITGKTLEEVKNIAVDKKGSPTDSELSSSVTISVTNYIQLVEKASANAS